MKRVISVCCLLVLFGNLQQASGQTPLPFIFPVTGGKIVFPFNDTEGAAPGKFHTGIDCSGPSRKPAYILASSVGTVHSITLNGVNDHGMGHCVILRHNVIVSPNGATSPYYTLYAHMDGIANGLAVGRSVKQGQIIGLMGASGHGRADYWGTTPRLHFEVKTGGVLDNPGGGGTYWSYTPKEAQHYGYRDPATVIGKWVAQ